MKNFLFVVSMLLIELTAGADLSPGAESRDPWPVIQPVKKSFHFVDRRRMGAQLRIIGTDGSPLYLLECYLNAYEHRDRDFDYSGDFECRLSSLNTKERYSTLLTEEKHQRRDWQSRGRFLTEELTGKCADYPEYGRVRHFRLRGMSLTLEIKNVEMEPGSSAANAPWNRDRIKELDLGVTIASDPSASSEIAEPTKYLEPPFAHPGSPHDFSRKCDKVLTK